MQGKKLSRYQVFFRPYSLFIKYIEKEALYQDKRRRRFLILFHFRKDIII